MKAITILSALAGVVIARPYQLTAVSDGGASNGNLDVDGARAQAYNKIGERGWTGEFWKREPRNTITNEGLTGGNLLI